MRADGGVLVVARERERGGVLKTSPLPAVPDVVVQDPGLRRLCVAVRGAVLSGECD